MNVEGHLFCDNEVHSNTISSWQSAMVLLASGSMHTSRTSKPIKQEQVHGGLCLVLLSIRQKL